MNELPAAVLLELVRETASSRGLAEETVKRRLLETRRFLSWVLDYGRDLRELAAADLERYLLGLREHGLSASSIGSAKAAVADLYRALFERKLILADPFSASSSSSARDRVSRRSSRGPRSPPSSTPSIRTRGWASATVLSSSSSTPRG